MKHPLDVALARWSWTPGDSLAVTFSKHACERFAERTRGLSPDAVALELSRMLGSARITRSAPAWAAGSQPAAAWLTLGDDVAMPLQRASGGELVALTTLTAGTFSRQHRQNLNKTRQAHSAYVKRRRRAHDTDRRSWQ